MSLAAFARLPLQASIAVCWLGFAGWLWYAPTDSQQAAAAIDSLAFSSLSGQDVLALILTCGSLLLATMLALGLRRWLPARPPAKAPADSGLGAKLSRALAMQLPPRDFLANWCGGLTVGEGLGVFTWLALNCYWLGWTLHRNLAFADEPAERLGKLALSLGQLCAPNLVLLFLPVPHTSLVPWLTGLSRNALVRYHRWLGHGTLWIVTFHALAYYLYWGVSSSAGGFWANFTLWEDKNDVSNLAGSIAWFSGLLLWISSLSWVRRHFYRVFYRCHMLGFLGFLVLSCAHYAGAWIMFAPGLILYAADLALRAGQAASVTTAVAARVEESARTATLHVRADASLRLRPLQEAWLLAPGISRWQWHPFTVASGGGDTLKFHIKQYGPFTRQLLDGLRQRKPLALRVCGPIGAEATADCQLVPAADAFLAHDVLVLFGGGVGVTALLSMLRDLVARRAAGGTDVSLPRHVLFVWTARSLGEFKTLDAPLLEAASLPGSWLRIQLHHTASKSTASLAVAPWEADPSALTQRRIQLEDAAEEGSSSGGYTSSGCTSGQGTPCKGVSFSALAEIELPKFSSGGPAGAPFPGGAPGAPPAPAAAPVAAHHAPTAAASPYFWSLLRPAQPKSFGAGHLALVTALAYLGALCGALLAASYAAQEGVQQWQAGLMYVGLMTAMALGLPFGLAVFPPHAYTHWRAAGAGALPGDHVAPLSEAVDASVVIDRGALRVRGSGAMLPLHGGRPNFGGIMRAAAEAYAPASGRVGVYAGGPKGMMTAVSLAVSELNAERGGTLPHYELHREATEL